MERESEREREREREIVTGNGGNEIITIPTRGETRRGRERGERKNVITEKKKEKQNE